MMFDANRKLRARIAQVRILRICGTAQVLVHLSNTKTGIPCMFRNSVIWPHKDEPVMAHLVALS
jgi:hypothetical protein